MIESAREISLVRQGLLLQSEVSVRFPDSFDSNHSIYLRDLRLKTLEPALRGREFSGLMREMHFDWLTLHYQTVHPIQEWEGATASKWIQVGSALHPQLYNYHDSLAVYVEAESPYIEKFNKLLAKSGRPLTVLFHDANSKPPPSLQDSWLTVREPLSDYFMEITQGKSPQGDLTPEEVAECRSRDAGGVDQILQKLGEWHEQPLSDRQAMALFRDSCRVTLLGLNPVLGVFRYPRMVVLAPVYVGDNLVGGLAFVGSAGSGCSSVPRELEVYLLGSLAINILTGLRLREEKAAEIQKGEAAKVAALNLAREEAVQRIAHALHNPLDSLEARVRKTSDLFAEANAVLAGLRDETRGLRNVSQRLLLAFSTRDLSKLLAPKPSQVSLKTFLETVVFLNKTLFETKGVDLRLEATEDCTVELDADMLLEVMDNLLKNAARYARTAVTIGIERLPSEKRVRLKVKDDGPGIAPDIRKHLFEPGTSELKDGIHGFGLYYSRELMRRQGGDLRAVDVQSGAEFSVEMRISASA